MAILGQYHQIPVVPLEDIGVTFKAVWCLESYVVPSVAEGGKAPALLRIASCVVSLLFIVVITFRSELLCLQLEKLPLSAEHALEMVSFC